MKGLLFGTVFNTPTHGFEKRVTRKRRLHGVESGQKKRAKPSEVEARQEAVDDKIQHTSAGLNAAAEQGILHNESSSIVIEGDKATVFLTPGQLLAFDGCAMVRLLEGRALMLGYSLTCGVQVLVSSSSKLCSALTFEACDTNTVDASRSSVQPQKQTGCMLEFHSYNLGRLALLDEHITFRLQLVGDLSCQTLEQLNLPSEAGRADIMEEDHGGFAYIPVANKKRKMDTADLEKPESSMRPTVVPLTWWAAANSILGPLDSGCDMPPIVPICGAKGTGKSTFGRFLVNRLLSRYKAVAYLDTDVGQPEFTIPGCLSLHILEEPVIASPVLHLRTPKRCFFYGDTSSKSDPEMLMKCIVELYDYFRRHYYEDPQKGGDEAEPCRTPLVINTHGWLKGVGYDLLVDILRHTAPTHLVEIDADADGADIPAGHFWDADSSTAIIHIKSPFQAQCRVKNAAELRSLRLLSYFQQYFGKPPLLFPCKEEMIYAEVAKALACHVPYQVSADDVHVLHLHMQVPASQSLYSLNAQLVGLAVSSSVVDQGEVPCVGFGIIRGVDAPNRILYLLTPCSLEMLEQVDMILHSRVEIPVALLQAEGYVCPYLCRNSVVEGTGSSILRRRKMPKRKMLGIAF